MDPFGALPTALGDGACQTSRRFEKLADLKTIHRG